MTKQLEALIASIKADISARKAMPDFGPEISIERIKIINRTKASFSVETTELLIAALEQAQQYAKQRDAENQDLMLTIGRLRVEREQLEASPSAVKLPEALIKALSFYEQVKRENPPVETGAWKDATEWVLKEAIRAAGGKVEGE